MEEIIITNSAVVYTHVCMYNVHCSSTGIAYLAADIGNDISVSSNCFLRRLLSFLGLCGWVGHGHGGSDALLT